MNKNNFPKIPLFAVMIILLSGCSGINRPENFYRVRENKLPTVADVEADCEGDFDTSETEARGKFEIDGTRAIMRGVIHSQTPRMIEKIIKKYPEVRTLVIAYSPGSMDDVANLEAGLMIHEAQLATCVPDGGEINSGAVDLFLAGSLRILGNNTWVGVHSWGDDNIDGRNFPTDAPEHQLYLDYYEKIGVDEDFYWFTLEAAPADGIHNMTNAERQQYKMESP